MLFAVGVFLVGGQNEQDLAPQLDAKEKELQERRREQSLEDQLAQAGEELKVSAAQLEELKLSLPSRKKV